MFKKILLFISLIPLYVPLSAWGAGCLPANYASAYVIANPQNIAIISGSTPDGTLVAHLDVTIPFSRDPPGCTQELGATADAQLAAWLMVVTGAPPTYTGAGQALAGYPGYYAANGIPGLYFQVVNGDDSSQSPILQPWGGTANGQPLVMGTSPWVACAINGVTSCPFSKTAAEYSALALKVRINFIKFGALVPGDYDIGNQYLFHTVWDIVGSPGPTNGVDIRLQTGILIIRVKTNCELDTTSTDLSVDFGELDDKGVAVGQRLAPYDKDFEIGFHGCADSVLPAITWDLNAGDLVDVNGNFPTYTPGFGSGVSAGIGFKLFDKSAGQFAPVTPGVQRTLVDTAANVVVDGKMRYPATQTTVKWPFAVRLIKSGTVPLGTFSGRATFTVAYP